jgi:hypothetical protein
VAESCGDLETLVAAGQVAAWRSGLPQYRAGALQLCTQLQPTALSALLGAQGEPAAAASGALLQRLSSRRFSYEDTGSLRLTALAVVGGFTGYGGQFTTPPKLRLVGKELVAYDHETTWQIHADAFGALLLRTQHAGDAAAPSLRRSRALEHFSVESDGHVRCGELAGHFPELAGATEFVADAELLAVTLPRSHSIRLIAVTQGAPC